jgi:hypothetical protein
VYRPTVKHARAPSDGRYLQSKRFRDLILGNPAFYGFHDHSVLLHGHKAINALVERVGLVIDRDEALDLDEAEILQRFDPNVPIQEEVLPRPRRRLEPR